MFRRFPAVVLFSVFSAANNSHAAASPEGWWGASESPLTINGSRPSFGENWYVLPNGSSVCALRVNGMNEEISGIRLYRGTLAGGHMTLYKGRVILGRYADEPELAKFVPSDPFHFFIGSSELVLRLQLPGERADRFILLGRLGDEPEDPRIRKAAEGCRDPQGVPRS
ncbi:hypothetical protein JJB11_00350 [Ramlibacter ginsenosidimutans]|uniref:Uncharacterized protein n=1 Tax=Ramlibacter ginsenosidimutans TaxID=502333 RepID=A0A934TND5_9BURK|nr:hypothetical protein [Ramlibacter ginsenosidimutans]MBK6004524.1 hypothetical protein [Ramlibacter ginsenosidimutans]